MSEKEEEKIVDLEEIGEKYEARGFFRRLGDMFKGFGCPRDSREYKLARIELQRLAAPLVGRDGVDVRDRPYRRDGRVRAEEGRHPG